MKRSLHVVGVALALSLPSQLTLADESRDAVEPTNADPAPPPRPVFAAAPLSRVTFEGTEAEVMLGPEHQCEAPCQMEVAPGRYQLTIDGRASHVVEIGNEPVKVIRLRGGSPNMLIAGVIAIVAGTGLFVAGLSVPNNCSTPAAGSGYSYCLSIPLTLEATGALWGVAGVVVTILGGLQMGRTRLDTRPPESVAKAAPRILPWATGTDGLHGGVGGLAVVF